MKRILSAEAEHQMEKVEPVMKIETTIGDLICAIQDAAVEACSNDSDAVELTHMIVSDILARNAERA